MDGRIVSKDFGDRFNFLSSVCVSVGARMDDVAEALGAATIWGIVKAIEGLDSHQTRAFILRQLRDILDYACDKNPWVTPPEEVV